MEKDITTKWIDINLSLTEGIPMWNITVYSKGKFITMYEFNTEREAKEAFKNISGHKILSEIIYFNDQFLHLATV